MYTVEADFGGGTITLPGARLFLVDENDKIKIEDVVFLVPDSPQDTSLRPSPVGVATRG